VRMSKKEKLRIEEDICSWTLLAAGLDSGKHSKTSVGQCLRQYIGLPIYIVSYFPNKPNPCLP